MFMGLDAEKYDRQYDDSYLFKRLGDYIRPFKKQVWGIMGTSLFLAVALSLIPILTARGIAALEANAPDRTLALIIVGLAAIAVTWYGANWLRRLLLNRAVAGIAAQMRKDAQLASLYRDMAFYDVTKSGKILSRITSDTEDLIQVIMFTVEVISQVVEALILFGVLFRQNVWLTLLALAFFPVIAGAALWFRKTAREITRHGSRAMAAVNDNIQESVAGISVAKNFRQEARIYERFVDVNTQSYRINLQRGFVISSVFPALNILSGFAIATVVYLGAQTVVGGLISVSVWYLFIQSIDRFFFPFINIASYWSQFQQAMSDLERVVALIDAENTVIQTDSRPVGQLSGGIVFEHVSFAYEDAPSVLKDFCLEIKPGENVAFVGHTGAGKSTIARLITRFYEFQEGRILVDGQDIRSFDLTAYRSRLGLVPQDPFLFSGTIADNIRYGCPGASDAEIDAIAHSIGGGEWMETLPDGLATDVGERGARLSMGQRQLVSLLRVLVQKPAIFILDEATASIDPFTEMQIQEAIEMILARSTSILIAHRLSTVRSADRIIVLREGEIIEEGNHNSLIAQGGHYAELYNTYFRHQSLSYVEQARERLSDS
jgi:ATP-binding cassette subfamily B protein